MHPYHRKYLRAPISIYRDWSSIRYSCDSITGAIKIALESFHAFDYHTPKRRNKCGYFYRKFGSNWTSAEISWLWRQEEPWLSNQTFFQIALGMSVSWIFCFWVIPREIYNSKTFSLETFFKMFFKQFKSIRIFLFRCYMKNVIVMNFFRFAA